MTPTPLHTSEVMRRIYEFVLTGEERPVTYLDYLKTVTESDVVGLLKKEKIYGDSWKRRGGVGVYMNVARKWDRIERQVQQPDVPFEVSKDMMKIADKWDIFEHVMADPSPAGLVDDIRDLRRYLVLVEAELLARGVGV